MGCVFRWSEPSARGKPLYLSTIIPLDFRERELLEVKKKITDSDFITRLIETILTRLSNISSETDQWEAAAGLIAASIQLLNYCSEKQINLLYDLSFEHLDHQGLELYFFVNIFYYVTVQ